MPSLPFESLLFWQIKEKESWPTTLAKKKKKEGKNSPSRGHYYGVRCAVSNPLSLIRRPYKNCTEQERNNVRYCVDDQQQGTYKCIDIANLRTILFDHFDLKGHHAYRL